MTEASPTAMELEPAAPPRGRVAPPLKPMLVIGALALMTVAAIRVGDGNIGLALAPALLAVLITAVCLLPLRIPMLVLLAMAWVIEAPGDVFADGRVTTPWKKVGEVLWGK